MISGYASLVMVTLQAAAEQYKEKHGKMLVLFLDGTDLLVKDNEALFVRLVRHAKVLANARKLIISTCK